MENIKMIFKETKRRMKADNMNFLKAFKYEIDMFCIMGPSLYIKCSNGTAIEGIDFKEFSAQTEKQQAIKGYLNVEQLTDLIEHDCYGVACDFYCECKCEYRNDVNACQEFLNTQDNGTCHKGNDIASRLYAEHVINSYNNGLPHWKLGRITKYIKWV